MCEYMVTSLWNPSKVNVDCESNPSFELILKLSLSRMLSSSSSLSSFVYLLAFLLNNGNSYHIAHAVGILEYFLEARYSSNPSSTFYFLSFIRRRQEIRYLGLGLVVGGQVVRSLAMIHASHSFSHHIAYRKKDDHSLVTTGIYA